MNSIRPELLAPAGDWNCLRAAVANGADAVFFGLPRFNARMRAENFSNAELPEVMRFLHAHGVKGYVTLNVLIFTSELADALEELRWLQECGVDAVIIQDVGLAAAAARLFPRLRIHASTQMTITSPEGVAFARNLGVKQVVLARELSLRELKKFDSPLPLEVFVHGALCVAYSGQCLTSESLGQRSANRGECAQACRMPYELVVDGALHDLGDKRYLLSPQDLAAVREIPELLRCGVVSFKIEGRLKSAEYVAAVTSVYRKALDAALAERPVEPTADDWYRLEMTFSRGLFSGWMHGVDHQKLVSARFGKKRGPYAGTVRSVGPDFVEIDAALILQPGDGVVFDTGGDTNAEQGGRIYQVRGNRLFFEHGKIAFARLQPGHRVWKTDDPVLTKTLRRTYQGRLPVRPAHKKPLSLEVTGAAGEPMRLRGTSGSAVAEAASEALLAVAHTRPLQPETLARQFSRLEDTPFTLENLSVHLQGGLILPLRELNALRRSVTHQLETRLHQTVEPPLETLPELIEEAKRQVTSSGPAQPALHVLCRTMEQLTAALACDGIGGIYLDFEDIRRYREAVEMARQNPAPPIFLATPRIQKAGEQGFFKLIENAGPDGVLIRNIGAIEHFRSSALRKVGDFSLNVANPLTAGVFLRHGLERLTISYDLNSEQVVDLLHQGPATALELTLHHHMPMFHMEHCVFAAFLSEGSDHTTCGRPCESHRVHLRDRVGMEHPLRADVGCRNTLFNAVAQTGAKFYDTLLEAGLRHFRIELLEESGQETTTILETYQALLSGQVSGENLWRQLHAASQLGVTRGTLTA